MPSVLERLRSALTPTFTVERELGNSGLYADTALRQSLPPEEEARVRWTIAGMFNISPDIRADNARRALALPELSAETRARMHEIPRERH